MTTRIYFIRHGEVHNPENIWYGRLLNFRLSEKGKFQIEKTAGYLADKNIDIIYSSPLLRTRQSAEILRKKLKLSKVHFSKKILEVKSSLQGSADSYLLSINYDFYASDGGKITGETVEQLSDRMHKFIKKIIKLHKGKNIAVVSHGDPIMMVKIKEEGLPITLDSLRKKDQNYIYPGEVFLLKI